MAAARSEGAGLRSTVAARQCQRLEEKDGGGVLRGWGRGSGVLRGQG
jgi:hypothetical protein